MRGNVLSEHGGKKLFKAEDGYISEFAGKRLFTIKGDHLPDVIKIIITELI